MSNDFQDSLNDPQAPMATSLSDVGAPLLVAFGGFAGGLGIHPSEFFDLTKDIKASRIFMRDVQKVWYQRGLPGVATDIDGIASFLAEKREEVEASRVVLVGNSMGGYAAVVLGILLDADRVLAFAPQTFIGRPHRFVHRDRRCSELLRNVHRTPGRRYLDVKPLLRRLTPSCETDIFYCQDDRLDRIHAERLSFAPNVHTHALSEGGHSVIKRLRNSGTLTSVVREALGQGGTGAGLTASHRDGGS